MTHPTARQYVQFIGTAGLTVEVTAPESGAEVTAEPITVEWAYSPGTQTHYRVQVYDAETGGTLVYDSQWTASATASHDITAGNLASGGTYWVEVTIRNDANAAALSPRSSFQLRLPTVNSVTGMVVEPWYGNCGRAPDPTALPGLRLSWDAITVDGSETFIRISVFRRNPVETTAWTRIACLTDAAVVEFIDYAVASRVVYEYAVIYEASDSNDEVYYSARQSPPPSARQQFDYVWLHEVDDPSRALHILSTDLQTVDDLGPAFAPTWGRTTQTAYTRQMIERRFVIAQGEMSRRNPLAWSTARALMERQNALGKTFCLRLGVDRERYFVVMETAPRTMAEASYTATFQFTEVYYEEEASCL
jgi:hypothetical protein